MKRVRPLADRVLSHLFGIALLTAAWFGLRLMMAVTIGRGGHDPAIVYLLAALTFLSASVGAAFSIMGPRLFDTVVVADKWLAHVPAGFDGTCQPIARKPAASRSAHAAMLSAVPSSPCDSSISTYGSDGKAWRGTV